MLSKVFLSLFLIYVNIYNCSSHVIFYINTKSNDTFNQNDPQKPVNIFVIYNDGKDVDIKKVLKISDDNTVDPVLNVNNTNQVNTTTMQNKDNDDYTLYPGLGYYKYHNSTLFSWQGAKYICELEGAHLVVINSQAEADLLIEIIKTKNNNVGGIHAGFYRMSTNDEFVTVLGGRFDDSWYNKWLSGYPSTKDSGYDCGYMQNDGTFFNYLCIQAFPFICEK